VRNSNGRKLDDLLLWRNVSNILEYTLEKHEVRIHCFPNRIGQCYNTEVHLHHNHIQNFDKETIGDTHCLNIFPLKHLCSLWYRTGSSQKVIGRAIWKRKIPPPVYIAKHRLSKIYAQISLSQGLRHKINRSIWETTNQIKINTERDYQFTGMLIPQTLSLLNKLYVCGVQFYTRSQHVLALWLAAKGAHNSIGVADGSLCFRFCTHYVKTEMRKTSRIMLFPSDHLIGCCRIKR